MVSLLSQYGPSRLCKNLILGWSIWVNLTFRILTCKWLEYKDKFNTCIAFHWIQGFTSVMFYQILDFIQRNQSNLCRFTTNLRKLKQFKIFLQKKKRIHDHNIYHSGLSTLTKCHCEATGFIKFRYILSCITFNIFVFFHLKCTETVQSFS